MDAHEAILTRRSTRNYKHDAVEPEKLKKILEAGRRAPSGGNSQKNHFFVIRDHETIPELIRITETAFTKMEISEDTYVSLKHSISAAKKGEYVFCYNAPVLIIVANRINYGNNMADCACWIENMMIAANALDLGSCWINQLKWLNEELDLAELMLKLGMRKDERIYRSVIVAYPASENGMPNRRQQEIKAMK